MDVLYTQNITACGCNVDVDDNVDVDCLRMALYTLNITACGCTKTITKTKTRQRNCD